MLERLIVRDRSTPLREAKNRKVPEVTIFIDTETESIGEVNGQEQHKLVLGCYETWHTDQFGYPVRLLDMGEFTDERGFYALIKAALPCRVVAHNWNFDAAALRVGAAANLQRYGYDIEFGKSIIPTEGGRYAPFLLTLSFDDGDAQLICSTNQFKVSLKQLGETFGPNKGDLPPREEYADRKAWIKDLRDYCENDVAILRKAWFALWDLFRELEAVNPGITIAESAMRLFTSKYMPDKFVQGSKAVPVVEQAEAEAYRGGRTDTFFKGTPDAETLYKYDVNSLYPSVMINPVPYRYSQMVSPETFEGRGRRGFLRSDVRHLILATVQILEDHPYAFIGLEGVPIRGKGLVFGIGEFDAWLWQPIYERAYRYGMIKSVHKVYAYDAYPIFREFVEDVYRRRKIYKENGDFANDQLLKYLMNSLYGKFGQRDNTSWAECEGEELNVMRRDGDGVLRFQDQFQEGVLKEYAQIGNRLWAMETGLKEGYKKASVLSIAGYITSMARSVLWDGLRTVIDNGGNLYMCDTDSLVSDVPLPPDMVDASELGKWALEGTLKGSETVFRAPKDYVWGESVKMKGIRSPAKGQSRYDQIQFPRFMTDIASKNPARRQRLDAGAILVHLSKTANGENNKRVEMGDGQPTLPIMLDL